MTFRSRILWLASLLALAASIGLLPQRSESQPHPHPQVQTAPSAETV